MQYLFRYQPLLLPAIAGASAVIFIDSTSSVRWIFLLLTILCVLVSSRVSKLTAWLTFAISVLLLSKHYNQLRSLKHTQSLAGNHVVVLGVILSESRSVRNFQQQVPIKVTQSVDQNSSIVGKKLLATLSNDHILTVGDKVWFKGNLALPNTPMNPNVFDKSKLLHSQGIALELKATAIENTQHTAMTHQVQAWAHRSRHWIRNQLTKGITDQDSAKIILAMFLGEKPRNGTEIMNDFKYSGTIHVFAVSGLHVMMIGFLFAMVLRLFACPLSIWVPAIIVIMFFYAIVTGMNPPAMRAAIMGSTVLLALLITRKPSLPNSLWLSAIIAMFWNTHCIFLPGFQLSYAVLISICLTGHWWGKRWQWMTKTDPFLPKSLFNFKQRLSYHLRQKSASTLSVSSSAWTGSSLLIWLYFGIITPIAIIASLPIMLLVFLLLGTCCLSLTLGSISDNIAIPLNNINATLANTTHSITRTFSSLSWLRYHHKPWARGERVIIYSIPEGGAATYIGIGGGTMLDAANDNLFYDEVWASLRKNGARLDSLIASHPDIMHIAGLQECIKLSPIKQLLITESNKRSSAHFQLHELAQEQGIKIIAPSQQTLPLNEESFIEILSSGSTSYSLADDRCVIASLNWKNRKILFLSDAGSLAEKELAKLTNLKTDILVIGKHSKDLSISIETILRLGVNTVICSYADFPVGEKIQQSWIDDLANAGIKLYRLDQTGTITITQDNGQLSLEPFLPQKK